jgi:lactate racemase
MNIELAYGRNGLRISLPEQTQLLAAQDIAGVADEGEALRAAIRSPIGSEPLAAKVGPGDRVVIVHSDITRATPNDRILPVLLAELEDAGIRREDITLLNALGTHRPQTESELRRMLGDRVVDEYRCQQHDAYDESNLVALGTTSFGNAVRVNRLLMEADVRILTGFIEPHFFAGFSGGPKAVLPALAGAESVLSNHGRAMIAHPKATWGITAGNPIWEEMLEVALMTNPSFLLNVTMNSSKRITGVFAGDMQKAHAEGCAFVKRNAMVGVDEPFDIVVTTNSGYPLDQNLYQCVKGLSGARQVVREGGSIVLAGACEDGIPSHGRYGELLRKGGSPQGVLQMLAEPGFGAQDQWQVQIQAQIQQHADVYIYSEGLSQQEIEDALLQPVQRIEETISQLMLRYGSDARICVLPEGPQTIAYLRNGKS